MKTFAWLCGALSITAVTGALRAEIEFRGYAKAADGAPMFSVFETKDETSRWLKQGGFFSGYKVVSFDERQMNLTVERDGKLLAIKFRDVRIIEARSEKAKAVQVKVAVTSDGTITLEGVVQTDGAFRAMLRNMAERGEPVAMEIQEPTPPTPKSAQTITSLSTQMREEGIKKWSVRVLDPVR